MSDHDLFSESEESCDDWPMTYEQFVQSSKRSRCPDRRVVLQTSCSSDEEESPPRSRAKRMGNQPKEPTTIIETPKSRSSLTTAVYGASIRERTQSSSKTASNAPDQRATLYARSSAKTATPRGPKRPTLTETTNSRAAAEKENGCTNSQNTCKSLSSIEVALLETNQLLRRVIKRVDDCEKQIKSFEKKFDESTTSCSSTSAGSTPSRKKEVPEEVRRETRRVYYMLLDEDAEFTGWNCTQSVTFRHAENQRVVNKLVTEVKGLNNHFISQHIRDAAYRFYRSQRDEESLKRRGKSNAKQKARRRYERRLRKLDERAASLNQMVFADARDREAWEKVMTLDMISSEDSGTDDGEEVLVVRPLPWRSARVSHMFQEVDRQNLKDKSPQSRRQMKRRVLGENSARPQCTSELPQWAFCV